jgi:diphthamide biosynthesis protein 3
LYLDSSPNQLELDGDDPDGADALSLLAPDIETFYSELPTLIPPFSNALSSALRDLRLIANAGDAWNSQSTESSRPRTRVRQAMMRAPVSLSSQLEDRVRKLRQKQLSELPAARTRMAATAVEVLAVRAAVLERTVMLLERAKHGALARATKAKAAHLAIVAQGLEGKLKYV